MSALIFRLRAELKKLGTLFCLLLVIGMPLGVFGVTTIFLLLKQDKFTGMPLDLIVSNNLGAWYGLLYPFILLVMVQNMVDVETKSNQLGYSKSYKRHWIDTFLLKAGVGVLLLTGLTVCNIVCNFLTVQIAGQFMISSGNQQMLVEPSISFLKLIPAFVPALFFHLMICFIVKRSGVAYLLGTFLIILGIPLANLTTKAIIPYSYGISVLSDSTSNVHVAMVGLFVMLVTLLLSTLVIRLSRA